MRKQITQPEDRLRSVESGGAFLGGVAPSTIRVWISRGLLTRIKVGRRTVVRESELLTLIKPQETEPAKESARRTGTASSRPNLDIIRIEEKGQAK
jgi:hypothetical protein